MPNKYFGELRRVPIGINPNLITIWTMSGIRASKWKNGRRLTNCTFSRNKCSSLHNYLGAKHRVSVFFLQQWSECIDQEVRELI